MLKYNGLDLYEFHTQSNNIIVLTKNDINTICELAKNNPDFDLYEEVKTLTHESKHWEKLFEELERDKHKLFNDIMSLVHNNKVEES